MPTYEVTSPDGKTFEVTAPEGASQAEVMAYAKQQIAKAVAVPAERSESYRQGVAAPGIQRNSFAQLQGPTFGFLDEIAGGVVGGAKSLVNKRPFSENYSEVRDYVRGASDQGMKDNPIRNLTGQIALTAPLGALGALKVGGGLIKQTLAAGGIGGVTGLINGAGESQAIDAEGIARDSAKSGAMGAALPLALLPGGRAVGEVVNTVAGRFNGGAAHRNALEKIAEAFARDKRGAAVTNPIPQAEARLAKLGPEAAVADTGGTSVRGLLDTLATLPGETKDAVERVIRSRQAGRAGRMIGAADEALDAGGARLSPTIDKLIEDRAKAAKPLYAEVYKNGVFVNDELRQIIDAANKLGAGSEAKKIATAQLRSYGLKPETEFAGMRELDYLKQGLDDIILANKRDDGTFTKVGAAVQGLKTDLLAIMDQSSGGAYKKARDAFAGPSAVIEAAKAGRKALASDDMAIRKMTEGMSPSELEGFRVGAFEALRSKLGKESGQTEILKMWKEPATREKLQAIFQDERSFREFAARTAAEARLKALEGTGRGSQTAARQYGAGDLDAPAIRSFGAAAVDAKTGNFPGLVDKATAAWNRVATPEPVRDAMGRILLSRGAEAQKGLMTVQQIAEDVARNRQRHAGALGLLGGLGLLN